MTDCVHERSVGTVTQLTEPVTGLIVLWVRNLAVWHQKFIQINGLQERRPHKVRAATKPYCKRLSGWLPPDSHQKKSLPFDSPF